MKKLIKLVLVVAFVFGGWALAAASLHVVRAPGSMCRGVIPTKLQIIPKNTLTFKETWIDTTRWNAADVAAHPVFVDRLQQTNKMDLIKEAMEKPAASEAQASAAPTAPAPPTATVTEKASSAPAAPPRAQEYLRLRQVIALVACDLTISFFEETAPCGPSPLFDRNPSRRRSPGE